MDSSRGLRSPPASDRLLTLYSRLGRYDKAIRHGLVYHDWLDRQGDRFLSALSASQ